MMVPGREKKINDLLLELDSFIFSGWFKWLFVFVSASRLRMV